MDDHAVPAQRRWRSAPGAARAVTSMWAKGPVMLALTGSRTARAVRRVPAAAATGGLAHGSRRFGVAPEVAAAPKRAELRADAHRNTE
jgi:hypothetical protein